MPVPGMVFVAEGAAGPSPVTVTVDTGVPPPAGGNESVADWQEVSES